MDFRVEECCAFKTKKEKTFWVWFKGWNIWAPWIKLGDISPQNTMDVVVRISHCPLLDSPSLTLCYLTTHPLHYYWKKNIGGTSESLTLFVFKNTPLVRSLSGLGLRCQGGGTQHPVKTIDETEDGVKRVQEHGFPNKWGLQSMSPSPPFSFPL